MTEQLKKGMFKNLEEVILTKKTDQTNDRAAVDASKGHPDIDQWCILVLGTLRLGLGADYDCIQELANQLEPLE